MSAGGEQACLVLGARGFVGSAVAAEAARRGYRVLGVDKDEYDASVGASCDLLVNANGNSKKFLGRENPSMEFDLSVRSVARSLQDFRFDRYVHLSSCDVYAEVSRPDGNREDTPIDTPRLSPYGLHKYLAEQLVRYYAPRATVFRMAGFVGRGLWKNSIHDLLSGQPLRVHPDSRYQYLNTTDLARIVLDLAAGDALAGQTLNIAGDGLISLREIAAMIPGAVLPDREDLPLERYEINIERIKSLARIPRTADTVAAFIREQVAARRNAPP